MSGDDLVKIMAFMYFTVAHQGDGEITDDEMKTIIKNENLFMFDTNNNNNNKDNLIIFDNDYTHDDDDDDDNDDDDNDEKFINIV